jgi:uncharacterized membrane protein
MSKHRNKRRAARVAANPIQPVGSNQVERRPQGQNQNIRMVNTNIQRTEAFSGPLPHPDHLERYGQIVNNGAERIFKMAESQMEHRMSMEKSLVQSDIHRSDRGLLYGFIIALVVTAGGVCITLLDKSIVGFITLLTPLCTIVGLFIYNRRAQQKENEEELASRKEKKKK